MLEHLDDAVCVVEPETLRPVFVNRAYERIWGRSVSEEEFLQLGERVWNLGRLFNLREGVERDDLPILMRAEEGAFADGLSAGKFIGEEAFAAALQEYYDLRGWDENGVPSEAKLAELGIDVRR